MGRYLMPLVNKREMARLIECSVPTLDALIAKHADFPVHRRGSNGVAWEFDPDAVVPFLSAVREAEERELVATDAGQRVLGAEVAPEAAGDGEQQAADLARRDLSGHCSSPRRAGILIGPHYTN